MHETRQRSLSRILSPDEHQALSLEYSDRGYTRDEIAKQMKISRRALSRLTDGALKKARKIGPQKIVVDLSA